MLTIKTVAKAFAVSVMAAFLLTIGGAVLFGSGADIDPALDWAKVNTMPYLEANTYILSHTKQVSGWETLKINIQGLAFVNPPFFFLIGCFFISSIILLWWVGHENAT